MPDFNWRLAGSVQKHTCCYIILCNASYVRWLPNRLVCLAEVYLKYIFESKKKKYAIYLFLSFLLRLSRSMFYCEPTRYAVAIYLKSFGCNKHFPSDAVVVFWLYNDILNNYIFLTHLKSSSCLIVSHSVNGMSQAFRFYFTRFLWMNSKSTSSTLFV